MDTGRNVTVGVEDLGVDAAQPADYAVAFRGLGVLASIIKLRLRRSSVGLLPR